MLDDLMPVSTPKGSQHLERCFLIIPDPEGVAAGVHQGQHAMAEMSSSRKAASVSGCTGCAPRPALGKRQLGRKQGHGGLILPRNEGTLRSIDPIGPS